jgi:hypothetical protein
MACPACGQAMALPERKLGNPGLELKRRDPPRSREQAVHADMLQKCYATSRKSPHQLCRLAA